MAANLREALEDLVAECRVVARYVYGEGTNDEAENFGAAVKAAERALADGVQEVPRG